MDRDAKGNSIRLEYFNALPLPRKFYGEDVSLFR